MPRLARSVVPRVARVDLTVRVNPSRRPDGARNLESALEPNGEARE
jgi:hypothetical protein